MNRVDKKSDYEDVIKNGMRGEYPRVLTTDGYTFDEEFLDNYDQWEPNGVIIEKIRYADDWPTFREATRRRILVKKGLRGEDLKIAIWTGESGE